MINLDEIMEQGVQLKLNGKEVTVKQLTIKQAKKIDKLQSEMDETNAYEKKYEITLALINNNKENIKFTEKDIENIPVKLQVQIHNEVNKYMYKLANDPN